MARDKTFNKKLKERKSNQSQMSVDPGFDPDHVDEARFEGQDQDRVERKAGKGGQTEGESFDKYPQKEKEDEDKESGKSSAA